MSIIDRDPDPEATAKESVQKNMDRIFMDQKYDERRHREFVSGLRNQQYKFGLPFASKEDLRLEGLKSLPDGPMQIAADQCINQMEDEKERAEREREKLIRRRLLLTKHIACMDAIQPFFVEGPLELQANTCSRLHHLKDASVFNASEDEPMKQSESLRGVEHTFVINHDWAKAFEGAEGMDGEIHLPYDVCAFEFRIRGKSIIAVAGESAIEGVKFGSFMHALEDHWYYIGGQEAKEEPVINFIWQQIRAICIALDAEVATHEVVRASTALNEKRNRSGKTALLDFHVVNLARRHRIANPTAGESGRKVRLHFRRGHWRHYGDHKTWIKWMLVGNPDLGFVQKHYAL